MTEDKGGVQQAQKKIEEIKVCPFCGITGRVILTEEKRTHILSGKIITGNIYLYKCIDCRETFTTTKTDTESFKNLK